MEGACAPLWAAPARRLTSMPRGFIGCRICLLRGRRRLSAWVVFHERRTARTHGGLGGSGGERGVQQFLPGHAAGSGPVLSSAAFSWLLELSKERGTGPTSLS